MMKVTRSIRLIEKEWQILDDLRLREGLNSDGAAISFLLSEWLFFWDKLPEVGKQR